MESGVHGAHGVRVLSHVVPDNDHERDHAPRLLQHTEDETVQEPVPVPKSA